MLAMLRRRHTAVVTFLVNIWIRVWNCDQSSVWLTDCLSSMCVCVCGWRVACGLYLVQSCHEHKYNMWKRASSQSGLRSRHLACSNCGKCNCHNDCGRQIAWRMSSVPFDSFAIDNYACQMGHKFSQEFINYIRTQEEYFYWLQCKQNTNYSIYSYKYLINHSLLIHSIVLR